MVTRKERKSHSREALLDAAAESVFRHGVHGTTIGTIQTLSGLSRGMINLHFKSKDNLLLAVAEELCRKYRARWAPLALNQKLGAEERLIAIIQADLSPAVLNARDIAIWFSYRAEFATSEAYMTLIGTREREFRSTIVALCTLLTVEGRYRNADPVLAANAIIAMQEGIWTDFHLNRGSFDRVKAAKACIYVLRSLFPKHFAAEYRRLCELDAGAAAG